MVMMMATPYPEKPKTTPHFFKMRAAMQKMSPKNVLMLTFQCLILKSVKGSCLDLLVKTNEFLLDSMSFLSSSSDGQLAQAKKAFDGCVLFKSG